MDGTRSAPITLLVFGFVLLLPMSFAGMIPLFLVSQPCPIALDCGPNLGPLVGLLMILLPWLVTIGGAAITVNRLISRRPSATAMTRAIIIAIGSWVAGLIVFLVMSQ